MTGRAIAEENVVSGRNCVGMNGIRRGNCQDTENQEKCWFARRASTMHKCENWGWGKPGRSVRKHYSAHLQQKTPTYNIVLAKLEG